VGEVKTGKKPDAIIYDSVTRRVFAFNGDSNSTTVIGAGWRESGVVRSIWVVAPSSPRRTVQDTFLTIWRMRAESLVVKIDARQFTVEQRWKIAPCTSLGSMAMDRTNRRLFIGCRSRVMAVMNADTGRVITTLPLGDNMDATAFDPIPRCGSYLIRTATEPSTAEAAQFEFLVVGK
jgi:DNA-binding beta-propeller fold protein YncE